MAAKKDAFSRIAILGGGGLMGHGIALACLQGSAADVTLISRRQETVDHGLDLIRTGPFGLTRAVERGKLSEEDAQAIGEGCARVRKAALCSYVKAVGHFSWQQLKTGCVWFGKFKTTSKQNENRRCAPAPPQA